MIKINEHLIIKYSLARTISTHPSDELHQCLESDGLNYDLFGIEGFPDEKYFKLIKTELLSTELANS